MSHDSIQQVADDVRAGRGAHGDVVWPHADVLEVFLDRDPDGRPAPDAMMKSGRKPPEWICAASRKESCSRSLALMKSLSLMRSFDGWNGNEKPPAGPP
jgi:hypothetical protein